jgi:hypothetical protein
MRIFSARACAADLGNAARVFEEQMNIHIEINVCSRHCARPVAEIIINKLTAFCDRRV